LAIDWPHAIGEDSKGALVWETQAHKDWKSLMKELAVIKIGLRTQFAFSTGMNARRTEDRHWLSYPVTNHSVQAWGNNARLPNSLRFKVRKTADGQLVGVIFHMPCLPPPAFSPNHVAIETVWQQVHAFLDAPTQKLTRTTA
jgi:CRISPR-associated protein Cmr1